MNLPVIRKTGTEATPPLLVDYEQEAKQFTWSAARAELSGLPGGGLNLAHEAVDRHLHADHGQRVALRWRPATGRPRDLTYAQLADRSSRFANLLNALGIGQGGSIVTLLDRTPEFAGIALGAWKAGAVLCPLPPTLRPEALRACLELGAPRLLITTAAHYRRQVAPIRDTLRPRIGTILLVEPTHTDLPGTDDFLRRMEQATPRFELVPTRGESPAFVWFTHARSGHPTGVRHVHDAAVAIHATGSLALDLHPEDVVWSTADPASPLGLAYGLIAPLTHGATLVLDEGPHDPERCYALLSHEHVTVLLTSPALVEELRAAGDALPRRFDLSALRFAASAGAPLSAESVLWTDQVWRRPVHDQWFRPEAGAILLANFRAMDIRPGSMGRPVPGVTAAVVHRRVDGGVEVVDDPDRDGELGFQPGWPSMFRGYLRDEAAARTHSAGGWWLTGDRVRRDRDGYFWFLGNVEHTA